MSKMLIARLKILPILFLEINQAGVYGMYFFKLVLNVLCSNYLIPIMLEIILSSWKHDSNFF